jgi:type VI secretion system protein VasG
VTVVPYYPLSDDVLRRITELQLGRIARRFQESYRATFTYSEKVVASIARRCTEVESGARNVDHILSRTLLPDLSTRLLGRMAEGLPVGAVRVSIDDQERFAYDLT